MDDRKIRKLLREALGTPKAQIKPEVLSELRNAPIDLYDSLPEHEKTIVVTAFLAAAGATQNAAEPPYVSDNFEAFSRPVLGEHRTRAGLVAVAAALERIPEKQRSSIVNEILERCGCNPTPELPDGHS